MTKFYTNTIAVLNIYKKPSLKSEVTSQMIYGDSFSILRKTARWIKIKTKEDNYNGYILNKNYSEFLKPTHKIDVLKAKVYKYPNKFRKINKPTNVLSFFQDKKFCLSGSKQITLLGDIVISIEKIRSEAKGLGKKFSDHFIHICIHGLLHLFGYNHKKKSEAKIMQEKEISILKQLSIPSPY